MSSLSFWDLNYVWYMIGFLAAPRLTTMLVFHFHVTHGFQWSYLFVPLTIWWMYPALALGAGSKLLFTVFFALFPRLLLGIIGYQHLPDNHVLMIFACVLGAAIDIAVKIWRMIVPEASKT